MQNLFNEVDILSWENSHNFADKIKQLKHIPELALLDIKVIPLDGFEMSKILRADNRFQDTKIVAVTADVMVERVDKIKSTYFDGLISKPIQRRHFRMLIENILAGESVWYIT